MNPMTAQNQRCFLKCQRSLIAKMITPKIMTAANAISALLRKVMRKNTGSNAAGSPVKCCNQTISRFDRWSMSDKGMLHQEPLEFSGCGPLTTWTLANDVPRCSSQPESQRAGTSVS
jgi:hypothetical protein